MTVASIPSNSGGQRAAILGLLRERGESGATNVEMVRLCLRYTGRIHELRKQGCAIRAEAEGGGVWRFVLVAEPEKLKALPKYQPRPKQRNLEPLFAEVRR